MQGLELSVLGGRVVFYLQESLWRLCKAPELMDPNLLARQVHISAPDQGLVRNPLKTHPVARPSRASLHLKCPDGSDIPACIRQAMLRAEHVGYKHARLACVQEDRPDLEAGFSPHHSPPHPCCSA